ncbi:hypothetical protein RI129_000361 [Pyrocoelia pectoralis]|uniref:Aminopeptidase n=1 Tax=Pyrocoelia pectoralis TaxID=417401 RepID=A0AAN7VJ20_9COLE
MVLIILISSTDAVLEKADDSFRLPSTIQPLQYNLSIEPNFVNVPEAHFNGSISIKLLIMSATNRITLHARNLLINSRSIKISDKNGTFRKIENVTIDSIRDFYIIQLLEPLLENQRVMLSIGNFSGNLNFDKVGFYLAKYKDKANNERVLALTDMQPIGARKAFPCFDEPSFKSTFIISIIRQKDYISVSNEELISTVDLGDGRFRDTYKETVNMSTYLVAFSVSDYRRTTQKGLFRVYAPSDVIQRGKVDFVLSIANDVLRSLENYTGIKYAMEKLDMFAVPPEYFEPGGMENWGLITFSENNLICTNESTIEEIRKCSIFTGHEIAHQWFGNLVTPSWWNFLWLSEGFSTYMEYYTTSLINPSWKMMDQFVVFLLQPLLKLDMKGSQYLNFHPHFAGVLPAAYTTYYKGAVIIRMLEHILTHNTFQLGIRMYLKKFAYGSVSPTNLYEAFQDAINYHNKSHLLGNLNVHEIMSTWDSLSGYPLVNVSRNQNGSISLSQEPFANSNSDHYWHIPINFVSDASTPTIPQAWLKEKSIVLISNASSSWILINNQQTGYYRVNYDLENWMSLSRFLNENKLGTIHVSNRAQLIDDAFELANFNYIPYDVPLNLSFYLRREVEYSPFLAFFNNIEKVKLYLVSLGKEEMFQSYIQDLLEGLYHTLGFEEKDTDKYLDKYTRISLMTWSCNLNLFECREYALGIVRSWLVNGTKISTNLEVPILCGSMQLAPADDWEFLYAKYEATPDGKRKSKLLTGLGCTGHKELLERFLGLVFTNGTGVSVGDRKAALIRILQIDQSRVDIIYKYFIRHLFNSNDVYQEIRLADVLCKYVVSEQQMEILDALKSFPHSAVIRSCIHHINKNILWLREDKLKVIIKWFEDYQRRRRSEK